MYYMSGVWNEAGETNDGATSQKSRSSRRSLCIHRLWGGFHRPCLHKKEDNAQKSYIALFTYAVTWTFHLELVSDLSTRNIILVLRLLLSRRRNSCLIYSDIAKTFKSRNKEIQYFFKDTYAEKLPEIYLKWRYNMEIYHWTCLMVGRFLRETRKKY